MKTHLDCMICFIRQGLDVARLFTDDEVLQEKVVREVIKRCSTLDLTMPPPVMGKEIHRIVKQILGDDDPYREIKRHSNEFAKTILPFLRERVEKSDNKWKTLIKLSIAGNIIDYGVRSDIKIEEVFDSIEDAMKTEIDDDIVNKFLRSVEDARLILFLADNAGEIVIDRLLIESLPTDKVVVAVKSHPIINDATLEDAEFAGLTELVRVMPNGAGSPGTVLSECSDEFLDVFNRADMIVSKGQGNFETLNDVDRPIWFLLKAKCSVVAGYLKVPINTCVFIPPKT